MRATSPHFLHVCALARVGEEELDGMSILLRFLGRNVLKLSWTFLHTYFDFHVCTFLLFSHRITRCRDSHTNTKILPPHPPICPPSQMQPHQIRDNPTTHKPSSRRQDIEQHRRAPLNPTGLLNMQRGGRGDVRAADVAEALDGVLRVGDVGEPDEGRVSRVGAVVDNVDVL